MHSPENWVENDAGTRLTYSTQCTSKPHQKCKRRDGWHVLTPEAPGPIDVFGRVRRARNVNKCNKYVKVLEEQEKAMFQAKIEASDEYLQS